MDIAYAVKQLDREIAIGEKQVEEKRATRESLYSALSDDEKKSVDEAQAKVVAQFAGRPAPPPPIGE